MCILPPMTRQILWVFGFFLFGCGGNRPIPDAGNFTDLGPLVPHTCDPVPYDAGTPPDLGTPPACFGTATGSCSGFTVATCSMGIGCQVTQCHGFPVACDTLGTMTTCMAQSGCAWSGTTCIGTPAACANFSDMTACGNHSGCVWSAAMMSCGGLLTPCGSLSAAQCPMQPGCTTTSPDAGTSFPDAGSPSCIPCAGTSSVDLRVVEGPEPLRPLAHALIHLESSCGASREASTGMDGTLHLDLDRTMGSWTLTAAATGHAAVSIVGISEFAFDGDIRLDANPFPMFVSVPVSGTVTGASPGASVQVDGFDFQTTTTMPGGSWSTTYAVFPWAVPLRFSAIELDPTTGRAVNAVFSHDMMRESMPVSGVALALPTPAATPTTRSVHVHFAATGDISASTAMPNGGAARVVLDSENDPNVFVGTVTFPAATPDFDVTTFEALPPTSVFASFLGPAAIVNLQLHDAATTDVTVPEVSLPVVSGTSLGDSVISVPASGWDFAMIDLGESNGVPPAWRIIFPLHATTGQTIAMPHLPAGVTGATLPIDTSGGGVSYLTLLVKMHVGRLWSSQASSSAVDDWEISAGGSYAMLSPAGR